MKKHPTSSLYLSFFAVILATANSLTAADVVKLNSGENLNTSTSWEGESLPGSGNTATFNATTTDNGNAISFRAAGNTSSQTWGALKVTDTGATITVVDMGTITVGALGGTIIDMSQATGDLTFSSSGSTARSLRLSTSSGGTINVKAGRTLTTHNLTNNSGTRTYTFTGGGDIIVNGDNFLTGGAATGIVDGANLYLNGAASGGKLNITAGSALGRTALSALSLEKDTIFATGSIISLAIEDLDFASLHYVDGVLAFSSTQLFYFEGDISERRYDGIITGLTGNEAGLASIDQWSSNLANAYFEYDALNGSVNLVIPEPSTYALIIGGAMLSIVALRRRNKKQ